MVFGAGIGVSLLAVFLIVAIRNLNFQLEHLSGPSLFWTIASVIGACLNALQFTIAINDSYALAHQLGHGGTYSGWIISSYQAGVGVSMVGMWTLASSNPRIWLSAKPIFVVGCLVSFLGQVSYVHGSLAMDRSHPSELTGWHLIVGRFLQGIGEGSTNFVGELIIFYLNPGNTAAQVWTNYFVYHMFCLGLGPVLASVMTDVGLKIEGTPTANMFSCVSFFQIALTSGILVLLFLKAPQCEEGPCTPTSADSNGCSSGLSSNRIVVVSTVIFRFWQCAIVAGLECVTIMVLQTEFSVPRMYAGWLVCSTFFACIPIQFATTSWNDAIREAPQHFIRICITVSLVASIGLCKFPALQTLPVLSLGMMCAADALIYPTMVMAKATLKKIELENTEVSGAFSRPNVIFMASMLSSLGRLAGPPVGRYILEIQGRSMYALEQMLSIVVASGIIEIGVLRRLR